MRSKVNASVSILLGVTKNAAGDDVDNNTAALTGVPAGIVAYPVSTRGSQSSGRGQHRDGVDGAMPRRIIYYAIRLPAYVDERLGDLGPLDKGMRLRNERNGRVYLIDGRGETDGTTRQIEMRVDARRIA